MLLVMVFRVALATRLPPALSPGIKMYFQIYSHERTSSSKQRVKRVYIEEELKIVINRFLDLQFYAINELANNIDYAYDWFTRTRH